MRKCYLIKVYMYFDSISMKISKFEVYLELNAIPPPFWNSGMIGYNWKDFWRLELSHNWEIVRINKPIKEKLCNQTNSVSKIVLMFILYLWSSKFLVCVNKTELELNKFYSLHSEQSKL